MPIICSQCNKEVPKNVFCSPRCKVAFHRGTGSPELPPLKVKEKVAERVVAVQAQKKIETCKHGSMLGLCKMGCK